jgi:hypothetical protein
MVHFLKRLGAFAAIQSIVLAIVVSYGSPRDSNHYMSAILDKSALLTSTASPRLIFVGGSNVAFGLCSEPFEQLGRHPINFGLHAGLGLEFPLRLVEDAVQPGDLILVAPEYSLLTTAAYEGDPEMIAQLIEQWPAGKQHFESSSDSAFRQFLDRDGLWLAHLWVRNARRRLTKGESPDPIYNRSNFNRYGDMVGHHNAGVTAQNHKAVITPVSERWVGLAVDRMNQFQRVCKDKGARVLFCYAPIPSDVYSDSRELIQQLDQRLKTLLDVPIVHGPEEVAYPRKWFFDTEYHLSKVGAEQRSSLLLACIRNDLREIARRPSPKVSDPTTR